MDGWPFEGFESLKNNYRSDRDLSLGCKLTIGAMRFLFKRCVQYCSLCLSLAKQYFFVAENVCG